MDKHELIKLKELAIKIIESHGLQKQVRGMSISTFEVDHFTKEMLIIIETLLLEIEIKEKIGVQQSINIVPTDITPINPVDITTKEPYKFGIINSIINKIKGK